MATTQRNIRVDDDLWTRVQEKCEAEGLTASSLVIEKFHEFLDDEPRGGPPKPVWTEMDGDDVLVWWTSGDITRATFTAEPARPRATRRKSAAEEPLAAKSTPKSRAASEKVRGRKQ